MTSEGAEPAEVGEVLVILDVAGAAETLERLGREHQIVHVGSARVIVVRMASGDLSSLASTPGVLAVSGVSPFDVSTQGLDDSESLFVAAWQDRTTGPHKQRRGNGLSWDAVGFAAPDAPHPGPDRHC